jgi:hypothetical protein
MTMTCGLCKRPIRGDEDYIIDHYKCSADLTQSLIAERDALLTEFRDQLRWLDRGSERYNRVVALIAKAEGKCSAS